MNNSHNKAPKSVQNIYKQAVTSWVFLLLSRHEKQIIQDELERAYPTIADDIKPEHWKSLKGLFLMVLRLVVLALSGILLFIAGVAVIFMSGGGQ